MSLTSFLRKRRLRGKRRPAPLVVRVANCASVSTGPAKARDTFRRALTTPGRYGLPDLVLLEELADVNAIPTAGDDWHVVQRGETGSPESALGIAARARRIRLIGSHLKAGTPGTREGGGIRRRPILKARLLIDGHTDRRWQLNAAAGHAAPARAPHDRARFLDMFRDLRVGAKGGDLNIPGRWARRLFRREVFSIGVLHLVLARRIPAHGPCPVDHGSDHPGVDVLLWPKR